MSASNRFVFNAEVAVGSTEDSVAMNDVRVLTQIPYHACQLQ